jgi:hypothetical protein
VSGSPRATCVLGFLLSAWASHCGVSSNPGSPTEAGIEHDASSVHEADAEPADVANPATQAHVEASVDASDEVPASDAGEGEVPASDAGQSDALPPCAPQSDSPSFAGAARSAGFTGSSQAYNDLFAVSCDSASACASACVSAGGTAASCASGSACYADPMPDAGSSCFPPPYWNNASEALSNSGTTTDAAEITLSLASETDALILSTFGLSVPDGSVIRGIAIDIRRSSDSGLVADDVIQLLQNGTVVGANRAKPGAWPMTLTYETYGGPGDTWGLTWTASSLRSSDFGVSISPRYTDASGNDRAYVDAVRATVFYTSNQCD